MDVKLIAPFLPPIVAFIVPFLVWYLNKREKNIFQQQVESQVSRFNLLDKMITLSEKSNLNMSLKEDVKKEIEKSRDILNLDENHLIQKSNAERKKYINSLGHIRRTLLLYKPHNLKFFIFQTAFLYILFSLFSSTIAILSGYEELYGELYNSFSTDEASRFIVPYISHFIIAIYSVLISLQLLLLYIFYRWANKYQFQ